MDPQVQKVQEVLSNLSGLVLRGILLVLGSQVLHLPLWLPVILGTLVLLVTPSSLVGLQDQ